MNDQPLTAANAWGDPTRSNLPEYTVSELSTALKRSIEENFSFVRVRGEISGWKRVASGHCYFALKDAEAVIDAVCWRLTAIRLALKPEDGMEVVCNGRLTTYPGRSKYQLVIDSIELAGIGALLKLLEDRSLCEIFGARNLAIAKERADWDKNFEKILKMFDLLLHRGKNVAASWVPSEHPRSGV